jgi:hypothetical protein
MTYPDYLASAELYLGSDWQTAAAQGPKTFPTAAHAIRFALEEAAPVSLRGARLRVGEITFSGRDLAALYRSENYPLGRKH